MTFPLGAGRLAALAWFMLASGWAMADDIQAGTLTIQHPWARATPKGAPVAGGYLTVVNHGTTADTLTGGSLDAATSFAVHDMTMENGIMKMRPAGPLTIPPGDAVTLSPAGRHIMFSGLKQSLKQGETVAGTLVFAHAGSVPVRFVVESIGARAPTGHAGHAMPGMTMD